MTFNVLENKQNTEGTKIETDIRSDGRNAAFVFCAVQGRPVVVLYIGCDVTVLVRITRMHHQDTVHVLPGFCLCHHLPLLLFTINKYLCVLGFFFSSTYTARNNKLLCNFSSNFKWVHLKKWLHHLLCISSYRNTHNQTAVKVITKSIFVYIFFSVFCFCLFGIRHFFYIIIFCVETDKHEQFKISQKILMKKKSSRST